MKKKKIYPDEFNWGKLESHGYNGPRSRSRVWEYLPTDELFDLYLNLGGSPFAFFKISALQLSCINFNEFRVKKLVDLGCNMHDMDELGSPIWFSLFKFSWPLSLEESVAQDKIFNFLYEKGLDVTQTNSNQENILISILKNKENINDIFLKVYNVFILENKENSHLSKEVLLTALRQRKWTVADFLITRGLNLDDILENGKTIKEEALFTYSNTKTTLSVVGGSLNDTPLDDFEKELNAFYESKKLNDVLPKSNLNVSKKRI